MVKKIFIPLLFILALTFSILIPSMASAHELEPTNSSPKEGEVLAQSPAEVRLVFAEELEEAGSWVQVFNEQGTQVDLGSGGVDLNNANHDSLFVQLPELPEGIYLVKWKVMLLDGDSSEGEYHFGVGNVSIPENSTEVQADSQVEVEDHEAGTGTPRLLWISLGGGVVVIAAIGILIINRSRRNP